MCAHLNEWPGVQHLRVVLPGLQVFRVPQDAGDLQAQPRQQSTQCVRVHSGSQACVCMRPSASAPQVTDDLQAQAQQRQQQQLHRASSDGVGSGLRREAGGIWMSSYGP